jgi:hypothetical protein
MSDSPERSADVPVQVGPVPAGRGGVSAGGSAGTADLAPGQPAEEWRPLADRVAGNARDFLDGLTAVARGEGAE